MAAPIVFVVDDEISIAEAIVFALQSEGLRARHFATGSLCIGALEQEAPDLILLDVGLPDGSGFDFFRRIRESCDAPVVFLTARGEEIDRVVGLEMGADDYVVKPFSVRELMARVRMVMRRRERRDEDATDGEDRVPAPAGPFRHDPLRRQIRFAGRLLDLTLHEYRLLETLLGQPGRVFSRAQLLERAWEAPDHRLERTVDSHIKSLRAKIREADPAADPIRTHRGLGYSLELPD